MLTITIYKQLEYLCSNCNLIIKSTEDVLAKSYLLSSSDSWISNYAINQMKCFENKFSYLLNFSQCSSFSDDIIEQTY